MSSQLDSVENGAHFPSTAYPGRTAPYFNDTNVWVKTFVEVLPSAITNVAIIQIKFLDGFGDLIVSPNLFKIWLSAADTGFGFGVAPTGGLSTPDGIIVQSISADVAALVQTDDGGFFTLHIDDTVKHGYYIAIQNDFTGQISLSRQLVTGDYGV